jgi:hypothetical protein
MRGVSSPQSRASVAAVKRTLGVAQPVDVAVGDDETHVGALGRELAAARPAAAQAPDGTAPST